MILRSLLFLLFLFQAGASSLLAHENIVKSKIEKSESKSKPAKSDLLEEVDDEEESKKDVKLLFPVTKLINSFSFLYQIDIAFLFKNYYKKYTCNNTSTIIWVQNFRI